MKLANVILRQEGNLFMLNKNNKINVYIIKEAMIVNQPAKVSEGGHFLLNI